MNLSLTPLQFSLFRIPSIQHCYCSALPLFSRTFIQHYFYSVLLFCFQLSSISCCLIFFPSCTTCVSNNQCHLYLEERKTDEYRLTTFALPFANDAVWNGRVRARLVVKSNTKVSKLNYLFRYLPFDMFRFPR